LRIARAIDGGHDTTLCDAELETERAASAFDPPGRDLKRRISGRDAILDLQCKPTKIKCVQIQKRPRAMSVLTVSTKGQIVLPAALRRRLGMGAGAKLEVLEDRDGVILRVVRTVNATDLSGLAGMVKVPTRGIPRRLDDFDPASLLARDRAARP